MLLFVIGMCDLGTEIESVLIKFSGENIRRVCKTSWCIGLKFRGSVINVRAVIANVQFNNEKFEIVVHRKENSTNTDGK